MKVNWETENKVFGKRAKAEPSKIKKLTVYQIRTVLSWIDFKFYRHEFTWRVLKKGDGFLIQLCCKMIDNETGLISNQHGGKHYLSSFAIHDEIVNKAWYACQDFIIHEAREDFKYRGQPIYHPHWKVDALCGLTSETDQAKRQ